MKKAALVALFFLAAVASAFGQEYTVITSTSMYVDNGSGAAVHPISGASLCFQGTNNQGVPITYTPSGGSPVTGPVCQTFNSSGGLTGSLQVANGATAQPPGLLYTITITDGSTTYLSLPLVSVSGSVFAIDTYALPSNGSALGVGYPHATCNAGATWTSNTLPAGENAATCNLQGSWIGYPPNNYCPAGTSYLTPQSGGKAFCVPPVIVGAGAPSGLCVNSSIYYQSDAPGTTYGCWNQAWYSWGGGGGGSGITSFQGRTAPAATLQSADLQGVLQNAPFSMTGSMNLVYDSATGTPAPTPYWNIGTGANLGALYGYKNLYLAPGSGDSNSITMNAANGAATFATGQFTISSAGVAAMAAGSTVNGSAICTVATACGSTGGNYYQTVQNATIAVTQRAALNFINTTGIEAVDNSSNGSSDIELANIPNTALTNSAITIIAGTGMSGGGSVSLGGAVTLNATGGGAYLPLAGGTLTGALYGTSIQGSGNLSAINTTAATSSGNSNSPALAWGGQVWNGVTSVADQWSCYVYLGGWSGSPTNAPSNLECGHSGSSGVATFQVFGAIESNTIDTSNFVVYGTPASSGFEIASSEAGTSSNNYSSPYFTLGGSYYVTGVGALSDFWHWQDVFGTGSNPTAAFTLTHSGTSGALSVVFPAGMTVDINSLNVTSCTGCGAGASGITNGTPGYIGLFGSATTINATSPLDYNITNAGDVSSTVPIVAPSFIANGSANGFFDLTATGTSPGSAPTSTVQIEAPSSVTAYRLEMPAAHPTTGDNILSCTAANPSICSFVAGSGAISSVSNSDASLTISPTTGAVVASLNVANANTWTAAQTLPSAIFPGSTSGSVTLQAQAVAGSGVTVTLPTASGVLSEVSAEVVAYSATPTFSAGVSQSRIVLTGNITSFTLGSYTSGQLKTLCFEQGSGPYTVTAPTNVQNFQPIGTTASTWYCEAFTYDASNSLWLYVGIPGSGGSMTWPASAGIMVYAGGSAYGTSLAAPAGTIVGTTDTQTLTNKTVDGVTPTIMGYVDATSSIQTQLNGKQASLGYTPTNAAVVPSTAPSAGQDLVGNAGGTAYAPVTMSGDCTRSSTGAITCTKSSGTAFGTAAFDAGPAGTIVGTTDTQTLTNKTIDGVTPTIMGYLDATSSIQTQLNAKAALASPALTGTPTAPTQSCASNTDIATGAYVATCASGSMTYPSGNGIAIVVSGTSWGTTVAAPAGTIVGTTDTQTLTNKTVDGVTPTIFGYLDATSSIQTQLNAKTGTVCTATFSIPATAIASGAKSTFTETCSGAALGDNVAVDFNGGTDPTTLTGFVPSTNGILTVLKWVTANTINVSIENNTAASITPTAFTLNARITR